MLEKKILPKDTISDEKLSNVSGGNGDLDNTNMSCPYGGRESFKSNLEYMIHILNCEYKNSIPAPDDLKPYNQG